MADGSLLLGERPARPCVSPLPVDRLIRPIAKEEVSVVVVDAHRLDLGASAIFRVDVLHCFISSGDADD